MYGAGRRQGLREMRALSDQQHAALAQMTTAAEDATKLAEKLSSVVDEVIWQEAHSAIRLACGAPERLQREQVAQLTDHEVVEALKTSLARPGVNIDKLPPDWARLVLKQARSIRDGAIADASPELAP